MPYFYGLLFILVLLNKCPATSLIFRQPSKSSSSVNSTPPSNLTSRPLSLSVDEWECDPWDSTPHLDRASCLHAIQMMPRLSEIGLFHEGGAEENIYRLPFTKVSENCLVLVYFVDDLRIEAGRWNDVYLKALMIVLGCVFGHGVGGFGLVGQHDRIRVSVRYFHQVAKGNRTDA